MEKKGTKKWIILGVIILLVLIGMVKSKFTKNSEYKDFTWPDTTLAKLLPDPESKWGKVIADSEKSLSVEIAKVDNDKFKAYYKKCSDSGFNVDYSSSETDYYAKNEDGYELDIDYDKEEKIMKITIDAPQEDPDEPDTDEPDSDDGNTADTDPDDESNTSDNSDSSMKSTDDGSVRAEVKDALDSYEAFMNEYVEFMKKYTDSNDTVSMLADYTKYMKKYEEMSQKMDDIEDMDLNDAENSYFLEVQARVTAKLAEIQ